MLLCFMGFKRIIVRHSATIHEESSAARVTLDVYDVAGRRVLSEDFGTIAPGRHPLAAAASASLPPGVYRVRARAGGHAAERVLVKIR